MQSKPIDGSSSAITEAITTSTLIFEKKMTYLVEERVFAPDSFFVKTLPEKQDVFKIAGKVISFNGEKKMYDENGEILFLMTQVFNSTLQLQYLLDKRSGEVYTVKKKGFLPGRGRGTLLVLRGKGDEGDIFMTIKGSASRSQFDMFFNEKQIAKVLRKGGAKRLLTGLDNYKVSVSPGFNVALAIILTVCIDEQYTEGIA